MEALDMFQGRTYNMEEKMKRRANQTRHVSNVWMNTNSITANNRKTLQLIASSSFAIRNYGVFDKD